MYGSYNIIEVRKGDGQGKWQVVGQEKSIEEKKHKGISLFGRTRLSRG